MRPADIVVVTPPGEFSPGVGEALQHFFIQELVAQPDIERLDERVLGRLARRDVMPGYIAFSLPFEDGAGGELGPIVADYGSRLAIEADNCIELPGDPRAGKRGVGDEPKACACRIIYDAEDAEPPCLVENIGQEVERPPVIWACPRIKRPSCSCRPFAAAAAFYHKAFVLVEPAQLLVVHIDAFPFEHEADATIAKLLKRPFLFDDGHL